MFLTSRLKQSPLITSPLVLLCELDRLLLATGWTREGTDPNSLSAITPVTTPATQGWESAIYGYRHPTAQESIWFRVAIQFYRTANNSVHTYTGFSFAPLSKFNNQSGSGFPSCFLTTSYIQDGWSGQDCDFRLGAGPDGFYIQQCVGERPCGFVVERHSNGFWSFHVMEHQCRYINIANINQVQSHMPEAILATGLNNYNGWYSDATPQGCYCIVDSINNIPLWKAQLSYLTLNFIRDQTSSQAVLDTQGALMKGPYFFATGTPVMTSNIYRLYHMPYSTIQGDEDGITKGFYKHSTGGGFQSTVAWRNL